jgi:hypothetical protein
MAAVMLTTLQLISPPETECGMRKLTGFHCPGCGGTRSTQDLLQGRFLDALSHNAVLFLACALFFLASCYLIVRMTILGKPAPSMPDINWRWLWLTLLVIVLFTVLRNIPTWPFILLAP